MRTPLALAAAAAVAALAPAAASADLAFVGQWGSAGTGDGQFQVPVGVAATDSNVFAVDQTATGWRSSTRTAPSSRPSAGPVA